MWSRQLLGLLAQGCFSLSTCCDVLHVGVGRAAMGHLRLKPQTLIPLFSGLSCNSGCAICIFSDWTVKMGTLLQLIYMTHICMDPVQKKSLCNVSSRELWFPPPEGLSCGDFLIITWWAVRCDQRGHYGYSQNRKKINVLLILACSYNWY